MTEREKLIELICEGMQDECVAHCGYSQNNYCDKCVSIADYLLANGVIVPPCKVGDEVYYVECEIVCKGRIDKIEYNIYTEPHLWIEVEYRSPIIGTQITRGRVDLFWNKIVFLTREEAEKALKERNNK